MSLTRGDTAAALSFYTTYEISIHFFSSRMRFMGHNWSATKQRLHPQSAAEISRYSALLGDRTRQCETSSGCRHAQGHKSASASRHLLLQAPQCPCSVRKRFNRDHCCRGRSKVETRLPDCGVTPSHTRCELTT